MGTDKNKNDNPEKFTINVVNDNREKRNMTRRARRKQEEKERYAERLNGHILYAIDNGYKMSEARLAKAVGVSQKTINRYRNGETLPDEVTRQKIEDYFDGIRKAIDEDMRMRELESMWDDEPEPDPEEEYTYPEYARLQTGFNSERLPEYTLAAQDYIIRHFDIFWIVENREREFIDRYRALDEMAQKKIQGFLESIPVSLELIKADGRGIGPNNENRKESIFKIRPLILGCGSHPWLVVLCEKNEMYRHFLQEKELPPKQLLNDLTKEGDSFERITDSENNQKFDQLCIEWGQNNNSRRDFSEEEDGVIKEVDSFYNRAWSNHENYYEKLNEMLTYTEKEWYLLFLFTRMQIADFVDPGTVEVFQVAEDYHVPERESLLWTYLDMLSKS